MNNNEPSQKTGLTKREYEILGKVKTILPKPFLNEEDTTEILDKKILAYAQMVIDDINYEHPQTGFRLTNFPPGLDTILILGINAYTVLMMQMKWTMNDLSYSDNGLTLSLDRVSKLDKSFERFYKLYKEKTLNVKNGLLFNSVIVLGTPRYQNQLGQFVRATFGHNF